MYSMTIDGKPADTEATFGVVNPSIGAVAAQAPECTADQLDAAMDSALQAWPAWRSDAELRRNAMRELAGAILTHADELIDALVIESGKPRMVAASEPTVCAAWLQTFADMDIPRETMQDDESALVEVVHRPLGVVAAITPWNFPLGLAMWKIAPALRAGNTVVVKPSPFSPLATLLMGTIMGDVLPPGVVNTVSGGDALGARMTAHPTPRKLTFTGSVAAGIKVASAAATDLKRVTLELGGNDAAILLDDVDVAEVARKLTGTAFFNSGQACALPKRIYAPAARYEEIVSAFAECARGIPVGDADGDGTGIGPLSTRPQFERFGELVADAIATGARVVAGGAAIEGPGFFFAPTVLADCTDDQRIVAEEQFGPALPILSYHTVDEAVSRANDTTFGLCGSVWSRDDQRAAEVAERLDVGTAFVNTHAVLPPTVPFGGIKHSGIGVENGLAGLLSFTETQVVHHARG